MHSAATIETLVRRVRRTLDDADASLVGRRVLAMCSGGADSVALVALLDALPRGAAPRSVDVLFVDYGMRDTEPDHAAAAAVAARIGARLHAHSVQLDVAPGTNLEAAARELRYEAARDVVRAHGLDVVCTGHTASDQLEQALLSLAGITGSAGRLDAMPVDRALGADARLVRPLLALSHADAEQACRDAGLAWAEDPTNADPDAHVRNALRHRVVPPLLDVAPGAGQAILRAARRETDRADATRALAGALLDAWSSNGPDLARTIDVRRLAPLPAAARQELLAAWLARVAPGRTRSTRIVEAVDRLAILPGRAACARVDVGRGACVRRDGYDLTITTSPDTEGPTP